MEYPESYKNLNYRERVFVDCYMNQNLFEPSLSRKTYSDEFASYVFAYQKAKDVGDALQLTYYGVDGFGNMKKLKAYVEDCKVQVTVKNVSKFMSLNNASKKVKGKCTKAINDIRTLMYSSEEDKSKELELKDAIFNSAMHAQDFKDRNDNRKMAMKMFGLDQVKVDTSVDIYSASGKQILHGMRSVVGNGDDDPIIPIGIDEAVENSKKSEE